MCSARLNASFTDSVPSEALPGVVALLTLLPKDQALTIACNRGAYAPRPHAHATGPGAHHVAGRQPLIV